MSVEQPKKDNVMDAEFELVSNNDSSAEATPLVREDANDPEAKDRLRDVVLEATRLVQDKENLMQSVHPSKKMVLRGMLRDLENTGSMIAEKLRRGALSPSDMNEYAHTLSGYVDHIRNITWQPLGGEKKQEGFRPLGPDDLPSFKEAA